MTTSDDPGPDGHEAVDPATRERIRLTIEAALLAFRPDLRERYGDQVDVPVMEPARALRLLADNPDIPPVLKHRILIDGLRRMGREPDDPDLRAAARYLLESTVDAGGLREPGRQSQIAMRALDAVVVVRALPLGGEREDARDQQ